MADKELEHNKKIAEIKSEINSLQNQISKASALEAEILSEDVKLLQVKLEIQEELYENSNADLTSLYDKLEVIKDIKNQLEEELAIRKQIQADGARFSDEFITFNNKLIEQIGRLGSVSKGLGSYMEGFLGKFSSGLSASLLFLDKVVTQTKAFVSQLDGLEASFVRSTGGSRDFATEAFQTREELAFLGIAASEAVETMGDLYSTFTDFSMLSAESRQDLIVLASSFNRLGGDAAAFSQTLAKSGGMDLPRVRGEMLRVAAAAEALGVPLENMSNSIVQLDELFAKMGESGMDTFLELQAAAKATGLDVQDLYAIVSQYDTFENAASAAGRLNSVLGGNLLDTYSLLSASEEERVDLLREAFSASGRLFDNLDRFQKLEVADALNISVSQASRLFGTTAQEVKQTTARLMHLNLTEEEFEARTTAAATAAEKLSVFMDNVALAVAPIVDAMNYVVDGFIRFTNSIFGDNGVAAALSATAAGLAVAWGAAFTFGKVFGSAFALAGSAVGTSAPIISGGVQMVGRAGGAASVGIAKLGTAMLPAALAIGGVAAAVGLAAFGFTRFVHSLKELEPENVLAYGTAFFHFSAGVLALAGAIGAVGLLGPAALGGLAVVAAGGALLSGVFTSISSSINDMNFDKLDLFESALFSLSSLAVDTFSPTARDNMVSMIREFGEAIDEIPTNTAKFVNLRNTTDSIETLARISQAVDQEQVQRIRTIVEAVSTTGNSERINEMAQAISAIASNSATSQAGSREIVIQLDGYQLGRWMERDLRGRIRGEID